mgnify:CR=1 FL=1
MQTYRSGPGLRGSLRGQTQELSPSELLRAFRLMYTSRRIDDREILLKRQNKIYFQVSGAGHEAIQVAAALALEPGYDWFHLYYRDRALALALGITPQQMFLQAVGAASDTMSGGRQMPSHWSSRDLHIVSGSSPTGTQYLHAVGCAHAGRYLQHAPDEVTLVCSGEGATSEGEFWEAINLACLHRYPVVFLIQDNGFAISVPVENQTPGGNIAENLASFKNLSIKDGDGTDPEESSRLIAKSVAHVRSGKGPALLRLQVPRLCGHSGQDTQAYKPSGLLAVEAANDPLPKLKKYLLNGLLTQTEWDEVDRQAAADVDTALEAALARPEPDTRTVTRHRFAEQRPDGTAELQQCGGLHAVGHRFPAHTDTPAPEGPRINMLTAIRRTLEHELRTNPKVLVFGEDVGPKGGVHAATMGLQDQFGEHRVFDTSLSEEGIIGRSVGMAISGLMPVPEIQFRKYADPATEQLNNCGTMRWRTANRFAAPIVVRMPGGYAPKCGDPWHSVCGEVLWAHQPGWQVCVPSNAEDAVGLLRAALRGNNPTIFFEHRALLDGVWARRPYPGDDYLLSLGQARVITEGDALTVVSWGAMVERCEAAGRESGYAVEVLDLRTISPWDRDAVLASVRKTRRCLVVHEDTMTAGFGAEVAATVADAAFFDLDAPVQRVAVPDIPTPYNVAMMEAVLPSVSAITDRMIALIET